MKTHKTVRTIELSTEPRDITFGYSEADLNAAFSAVQDGGNWKKPIDAVVDADQVAVTCAAIVFYTGTIATVRPHERGNPCRFRVQAAGYYAGPCN